MSFFPVHRPRRIEYRVAYLAPWLAVMLIVGCSRIVPMPEVDLDDPKWTIWEGQALWTPRSGMTAVAGELIAARNPQGEVLVSFSKSPFPIFTAQTSGRFWRIDLVDKGRSYSGIGRPPEKFVWFRFPDLFKGAEAPKQWEVHQARDGEWSISNRKTGETIRVVLDL